MSDQNWGNLCGMIYVGLGAAVWCRAAVARSRWSHQSSWSVPDMDKLPVSEDALGLRWRWNPARLNLRRLSFHVPWVPLPFGASVDTWKLFFINTLVNNIMDFIGLYIAYGQYKWPLCFDIVFLTENHVWRGTKCEVGCIIRAKRLISGNLRIYQQCA